MKMNSSGSEDEPNPKRARRSVEKLPKDHTSSTKKGTQKLHSVAESVEEEVEEVDSELTATVQEECSNLEMHKNEIDDKPSIKLSEYELQIKKNIEERTKFMNSLDILTVKEELLALSPTAKTTKKTAYRGIVKESRTPVRTGEVRRSLRQRNRTPDGSQLTLAPEKEISKADTFSRPPSGPAPMMDYYERPNKEECQEFVGALSNLTVGEERESVWSGSVANVLKVMKSMKIEEKLVAKVTPQRTFCIQVHPSLDKTLVLIGAKWGELGVWDVERKDKSAGAYCFNVHSRPINCLTLKSSKPEHVYTTSYDGTVRRTDLVSGIVEEIYSYCEPDMYGKYISWHAHQNENCIMVASSEGSVVHVDVRSRHKSEQTFVVSDKSVKVISIHPTQNNYFATASSNTVALWDMRKHKKKKPLDELKHGKFVSGLEFSPVTGKTLLTTSKDHYLRFISCGDLTTLKTEQEIRHFNETGRWLTTFKARFVPNREDLIYIGSLSRPRRIEVFDNQGKLQHEFKGDNFASVTSVNAMHPTRSIIAGSNSSGRAHVFMA